MSAAESANTIAENWKCNDPECGSHLMLSDFKPIHCRADGTPALCPFCGSTDIEEESDED